MEKGPGHPPKRFSPLLSSQFLPAVIGKGETPGKHMRQQTSRASWTEQLHPHIPCEGLRSSRVFLWELGDLRHKSCTEEAEDLLSCSGTSGAPACSPEPLCSSMTSTHLCSAADNAMHPFFLSLQRLGKGTFLHGSHSGQPSSSASGRGRSRCLLTTPGEIIAATGPSQHPLLVLVPFPSI